MTSFTKTMTTKMVTSDTVYVLQNITHKSGGRSNATLQAMR